MDDGSFPATFGPYLLLRSLGRGNHASVFLAQEQDPDRLVAVKVLTAGRLARQDVRERFLREIELVARLRHPHILAVHTAGDVDGIPYYTMDYIDGANLGERLGKDEIKLAELVRILRLVAEAVHYAHEQGVVHRDLKPANVLVDRRGWPFVTDFGLARDLLFPGDLTHTQTAVGTPHYMAPEQARGESGRIGRPTDVYALGVILYQGLAGSMPYDGSSPLAVLRTVAAGNPTRPPSRRRKGVPRDLEAICLRCLEPEMRRRYSTAEALAEDLRAYEQGRPVRARPWGALETAERFVVRHWRGIGVALISVALALSLLRVEFKRRTEHYAQVQRQALGYLEEIRKDPLGSRLPVLRQLWEAEPAWPGWQGFFQEAATWAEEHQLWWLALRFLKQGPPGYEGWVARGRILALLGRLGDAEIAWRNAESMEAEQAAPLAALTHALGPGVELPLPDLPLLKKTAFADLNGDGLSEFICIAAGPGGSLMLLDLPFERGRWSEPQWFELPDDVGRAKDWDWIAGWDATGDGVEEIAVHFHPAAETPPHAGTLAILSRDVRSHRLVTLASHVTRAAASRPRVADIDADGDRELLVPLFYPERGILILDRITPDGLFRSERVLVEGNSDLNGVAVGDADADGLPELHLARGGPGGFAIESLIYDETQHEWASDAKELFGLVSAVEVVDLDGDTDAEVVVSRSETPYHPALTYKEPYRRLTGLAAFEYRRGAYSLKWTRDLKIGLEPGPDVSLRGVIRPGGNPPPWAVVYTTSHSTGSWDCCNSGEFSTLDFVPYRGEPLRLLVTHEPLLAELDGDSPREIAVMMPGSPPRLRILGLRGEVGRRPDADDRRSHRVVSATEPASWRDGARILGRHSATLDLNIAAELLWERPRLEREGDREGLALLDSSLALLGRDPDGGSELEGSEGSWEVTHASPTFEWNLDSGGADESWKFESRGDERCRPAKANKKPKFPLRWCSSGEASLLSVATAPLDQLRAVEMVFRIDRMDFGQTAIIGLFDDDLAAPTPLLAVQLNQSTNHERVGGRRHHASIVPAEGVTWRELRRPEYAPSFDLGLSLRLWITQDPVRHRARVLLHPYLSDPEGTAILDRILVDCTLGTGGYRVGLILPETNPDTDEYAGNMTLSSVRVWTLDRAPNGKYP